MAASDTAVDLHKKVTVNVKSGLNVLHLGYGHYGGNARHLTKIPPAVFELPEINELWLNDHKIYTISKDIVKLTHLKWLALYNNQLKKLPKEIGELIFLEWLMVDDNYLYKLPPSMGQLKHLRLLHLANNKFVKFPLCICDMDCLEELDMNTSWLCDLPEQMIQLKNLRDLNLSNSKFVFIPPVMFKLASLEELEMALNKIDNIPVDITNLTKLTSLNLEKNYITSVPCQLTKLGRLRDLRLGGNPVTQPPMSICRSSIRVLFSYLREQEKSECVRFGRQKLMLVGRTGAGKTSLQRSLVHGQPHLAHEDDRTVVLAQTNWMVADDVWLQVIDFGGHDVYTIMPQFFLSDSSILFIVVDLSAYSPDRFMEAVGVWLGQLVNNAPGTPLLLVGTHVDGCDGEDDVNEKTQDILRQSKAYKTSILKSLERKKVEIKNQIDNLKYAHSNEQAQRRLEAEDTKLDDLTEKHGQTDLEMLVISSANGNGLALLKQRLMRIVEDTKICLPSTWHKFASKIMDMANSTSKVFLTWDEIKNIKWETSSNYEAIWGAFHNSDTKNKAISDAFESLHRMGCVLYYPDNKKLCETVFHNWPRLILLLQAVLRHDISDVLQYTNFIEFFNTQQSFDIARELFLSQGMLSMSLFRGLLAHFKLDPEELKTVIYLLEQFDLCYEIKCETGDDNKTNLHFPWYLKCERPQTLAEVWLPSLPIGQHHLQLDVCFASNIPIGFFERLVVQLEKYLHPFRESRINWKDGLSSAFNYTRLLVERLPDINGIQVHARGPDITESWKIICHVFRDVQDLLKQWVGVLYDCFFVCPHCIAVCAECPIKRHAEDIMLDADKMKDNHVLPCKNASTGIPSVLIYPTHTCMSDKQKESLCEYMQTLEPQHPAHYAKAVAGENNTLSGNTTVSDALSGTNTPVDVPPLLQLSHHDEQETVWKKALRINRIFLLDNLEPQDVLNQLLQSGTLSQSMYDRIRGVNRIRQDVSQELLDVLSRLSEPTFQEFLSVLPKSNQQFIADKLQESLDKLAVETCVKVVNE